MLLIQASSQSQEKATLVHDAVQNLRDKHWQTTDAGCGPVILLAPSAALLSLAFQCIHVSGELSFSSKNKLLWEFPAHAVSVSHATSCLVI